MKEKNLVLTLLLLEIVVIFSTKNFRELEEGKALKDYYFNQLNQNGLEFKFYNAIKDMYIEGKMQSGTYSIDMVEKNYLSQATVDSYAQNIMPLVYALGVARDAFKLDYPECYYVDFDKVSVRTLSGEKGGNKVNICLLGIGRTENYLRDNFDESFVKSSLIEFESLIQTALTEINKKTSLSDKIIAIHDYITNLMTYKLELSENVKDIKTLRTAYGALKYGEGMCETYASIFKVLADRIDAPCISIIGKYYENGVGNLHMWNNCYLDGKWLAIDTTHDDSLNSKKYCLGGGEVMINHVPDKYTSEAQYPFYYPTVYIKPSYKSYIWNVEESIEIHLIKAGVYQPYKAFNVSYMGMGYKKAMEKNIYIVYKLKYSDKDDSKEWTGLYSEFFENNGYDQLYKDEGNSFLFIYEGLGYDKVYFGTTKNGKKALYGDKISEDDVENITPSLTNNNPRLGLVAPLIINASPSGQERLEIGKGYDVKFEFDEDLEITGEFKLEVTHSATIELKDVYYENLKFTSPKTITFRFYTSKRFEGNAIHYTFNFINIRGKESKKQPFSYQLFVLNDSNIGCPLKYGITYTTFGQATLIENRDLRTNGWIYEENGINKTVTQDLSVGVSLVVSRPSIEIQSECNSKIKTSTSARTTSTYDINLLLCCIRMKFLPNGQRVKIMVPFPSGYGPDDAGVDFEAYHYNNKTKEMEKVTCLVTEGGLILYIDHFSPFTIAAIDSKGSNQKYIMTILNEGGSIINRQDYYELSEGDSVTLNILPNLNYVIDYLTLDGKLVKDNNNQITIKYEQIAKKTGVLEIYFIYRTTKEAETTLYKAVPLIPTAKEPNVLISVNELNEIVSTVTGDKGILLYKWFKDGKVIINANSANYTLDKNDKGIFKLEVSNMVMRTSAKSLSNELFIDLTNQSFDTEENSNDKINSSKDNKNSIPIWAIILIIVFSIALIGGIGFLIFKLRFKKEIVGEQSEINRIPIADLSYREQKILENSKEVKIPQSENIITPIKIEVKKAN